MDTTGGLTTSGKMLISCSQSKLSRDRYFHLTPYLLQDVSLNWMIVCLIQIITRFCSNLLLTSERYQKYILLKNQKIYIILPISHRTDSDGLCFVNIGNCLYFSRRLVTSCWKKQVQVQLIIAHIFRGILKINILEIHFWKSK